MCNSAAVKRLACLLSLLLATGTFAATYTVDNNTDQASPLPGSLRYAVNSANATPGVPDTIDITYNGTITLQEGELLLTDDTTIQGPGVSLLTISGNTLVNKSRIFGCAAAKTISISGITFANGEPPTGSGGALSLSHISSALTVSNCNFIGNKTTAASVGGGAVYCASNPATFTGCRFEDNAVADGPGGAIYASNILNLTNCQFVSNQAALGAGGGAVAVAFDSTLTNCLFDSNQFSGGNGGAFAVVVTGCSVSMTDCQFLSNQVTDGHGGAVSNIFGSDINPITRCAFENNSASSGYGGAIYTSGMMYFSQCLVASNLSYGENGENCADGVTGGGGGGGGLGGGIYVDASGQVSVNHTTISSNIAMGGDGGAIDLAGTGVGGGPNGGAVGNPGVAGGFGSGGGAGNVPGASGGAGGLGGGGGGGASTLGAGGAAGVGGGAGATGGGTGVAGGGGGGAGIGGGVFAAGVASFVNATVTANECYGGSGGSGAQDGSGVGGGVYGHTGSAVDFWTCIVAGNTASADALGHDVYGVMASQDCNVVGKTDGSNLVADPNDRFGTAAVPLDPRLGPLANNGGSTKTHAMLSGSPAFNRKTALTGGVDQRGWTRGYHDAGAYEAHPFTNHQNNQSTTEDAAALVMPNYNTGDSLLSAFTAFTAVSSNPTLIPDANLVLTDILPTPPVRKRLTITPAANQHGTATITFTVYTATTRIDDTFTVTVAPVADTPSVTNASTPQNTQSTSGLVLSRNALDGSEVNYFKIMNISNGALYYADGTTAIANGTFIPYAVGAAGLKFTPSAGVSSGSFDVYAATDSIGAGLSASAATATITVLDPPVITGSATATGMVGVPFSHQLSGTGSGTIVWSCSTLPAGLTLYAATIFGTPREPGATDVTVTATATGGQSTQTLRIVISAPELAITSPLQAEGKVGAPFSYLLTGRGTAPLSFTASNLPRGLLFSGATIAGEPAEEGTFEVSLGIIDVFRTSGSAKLVLTIHPKTFALPPGLTDISAFPTPAFTNEAVTFMVTVRQTDSAGVRVKWDFGDGSIGIGSEVTHAFTAAGTYTVTAVADDGTQQVSKSLQLAVTDENPNAPSINGVSLTPNPVYTNAAVQFSASTSDPNNDAVTVRWDFGDGSPQQTGSSVQYTYSRPGSFFVCVFAEDTTGLSARSWEVPILVRNEQGRTNVKHGETATPSPLNGMSVRVADSDNGFIVLEINLDTLIRNAYDVSTIFGRQAQSASRGLRPANKFESSGIYVATTTAKDAGTKTERGKARKTIAISRRETGETPLNDAEPESHQIEVKRIAGKFHYSDNDSISGRAQKTASAPQKTDLVCLSGCIELPEGFDPKLAQEVQLAIGNVVQTLVLNSRGRGYNTQSSIQFKLSKEKAKRGTKAKFSAKIAMPDLDAAGFDTEGVTPTSTAEELTIQCALLIAGSTYVQDMPVTYKAMRRSAQSAAESAQILGRH